MAGGSRRNGRLAGAAGSLLLATTAAAQVRFDGSLGAPGDLTGPNVTIPADRGRRAGGNLFHSFSDFNVNRGQRVAFTGPADVRNVLARVSGGRLSSINGTLACEIDGANLYLMNPAGVLLGPGAALEVRGSFVATTADRLRFADGGRLSADPAAFADDVLTAAPVAAFGFVNPRGVGVGVFGDLQSQPIVRTVAAVPTGQTFSIIADGGMGVSFANVEAEAGRVNLVCVNSPGEVLGDGVSRDQRPDVSGVATLGDITVTNGSNVLVDGPIAESPSRPSGDLSVQARNISMGFISNLSAVSRAPGTPGLIDIDLTGRLSIDNNAQIQTGTSFGAPEGTVGPDLDVTADVISITNANRQDNLSSAISSLAISGRPGGDVRLRAGVLEIGSTNDAPATIISGGQGPGGDVTVDAGGMFVTGQNANVLMQDLIGGEVGAGVFRVGRLRVTGGAQIVARTNGDGRGGAIRIESAGDILLSGSGGIRGNAAEGGSELPSGVSITARALTLRDDAFIATETLPGGNVTSGNEASDGGPITLRLRNLRVFDAASIAADANTTGTGGDIDIIARRIVLDGRGSTRGPSIRSSAAGGTLSRGGAVRLRGKESIDLRDRATVSAITVNLSDDFFNFVSPSGPGGAVQVRTPRLTVSGQQSTIAAASVASGDGGTIDIDADEIELSGDRSGFRSPAVIGSFAPADVRTGDGGAIRVRASRLTMRQGAQILTTTQTNGAGGAITLEVGELSLAGREDTSDGPTFTSIVSTTRSRRDNAGRGGDVTLRVDGLVSIRDEAFIQVTTFGRGRGGRVDLAAGQVELTRVGQVIASARRDGDAGEIGLAARDGIFMSEAALISARAETSRGGTVRLDGGNAIELSSGAVISARSEGDGGNISLRAADRIFLTDAQVTASSGATGGRIDIDPSVVVINRSLIDGRSAGTPVPVTIVTDGLLVSTDSRILTDAPAFTVNNDIVASLAAIDASLADAAQRLADACGQRYGGLADLDGAGARPVSTFIVEGRGGTPWTPGAPLPAAQAPRAGLSPAQIDIAPRVLAR